MVKNCHHIEKMEDGTEIMVDMKGVRWPQHMPSHTCNWAQFQCGHCDTWGHARKECKFWVAKAPSQGNGSGPTSSAKRDTGRPQMKPDLDSLLAEADQEEQLADAHAARHAELLVQIAEMLEAQKDATERAVKKLFEKKEKK